jgi:hypothetical protein
MYLGEIRMRQSRQYQSPCAAMVWSMVLPGFGQLYNRDFLIGAVLLILEFTVNLNSNLNLVLLHSFSGQLHSAHQVIDYRWGLFYPSIYGYSSWQAFNSAKVNNIRLSGKEGKKRTYLTGFFIGLVLGMDFGLFWHDSKLLIGSSVMRFLDYPVFGGIILGLLFGVIGHLLENGVYRRQRTVHK